MLLDCCGLRPAISRSVAQSGSAPRSRCGGRSARKDPVPWPSPSSDLEHTEAWRVSLRTRHSPLTVSLGFSHRSKPAAIFSLALQRVSLPWLAQAADLPVKAKPVEYVKICSLYGVGFYYIPGTDMCIKIGGWVRAENRLGRERLFDADLRRKPVSEQPFHQQLVVARPRLHHR